METVSKLIGIHTYGRNGRAWMTKKTSHKPCTLCFNLSGSAVGRQRMRHSHFHLSSDIWSARVIVQHTHICSLAHLTRDNNTVDSPQSCYSSAWTHKYICATVPRWNFSPTKQVGPPRELSVFGKQNNVCSALRNKLLPAIRWMISSSFLRLSEFLDLVSSPKFAFLAAFLRLAPG